MATEINKNTIMERTIEFIVIGSIFYLSSHIVPGSSEINMFTYSIVYSCVVLLSVCIGKHLISVMFTSTNPVIRLMLRNATGLFIGTCIMFVFGILVSALSEIAITVILASIIAFFVLGTLSPLAMTNKHDPSPQRT